MVKYTNLQMKYINSVGGKAHQSAVEIIGELESEIETKSRLISSLYSTLASWRRLKNK